MYFSKLFHMFVQITEDISPIEILEYKFFFPSEWYNYDAFLSENHTDENYL